MAETIPMVQRQWCRRADFPDSLDILFSLRADLAEDTAGVDQRHSLHEAQSIVCEAAGLKDPRKLSFTRSA